MTLSKNQIYMALLAGILLLVIALPSKMPGKKAEPHSEARSEEEETGAIFCMDEAKYVENLEERLTKALEHVQGVGKAEVMITLRSRGQKIIEKDYRSAKSSTQEQDSSGGKRVQSKEDISRESVYAKGKSGEETPCITKEMTPDISGVLIVCTGGDSPCVARHITQAVQALFGVEAHKIKIMKRTAQ